jgi:hypothetical protein
MPYPAPAGSDPYAAVTLGGGSRDLPDDPGR